ILKKISAFSSQFKDIDLRFEKVFIETTDIIESISSDSEQLTFDSEKFNTIQSRLFKIQELENKHNVSSISQLIEVKNKLNDKVESTDNIDSEIEKLNLEILNIEKDLTKEANQIYRNRLKTADGLQNEIEKIFSLLSLNGCLIRFEFIKEEKLNSFGIDNLNVLYSPGETIELKPLSKIASGGEKSRILLAIKSVFAKKNSLPTIIFDEIDSGTSGEIAESIGFLMKEMSKKIQILSITHLAQVASKGDYHFKVVKASDNGKSTTSIVELSDKERVSEIAGMISGKKITNSALNQAEELLK
ncbi:MAG: DNA repair protein RecN, partial [Bacteroidota bacterium]|nr:DNA repair protein RecN [Bacteroidota bacterium]